MAGLSESYQNASPLLDVASHTLSVNQDAYSSEDSDEHSSLLRSRINHNEQVSSNDESNRNDALNEFESAQKWTISRQGSMDMSGVHSRESPTSARTLGTFAGVFCPVAMAMFSTLLFLRLGFVLGQAGLIQSIVMFVLAYVIMYLTILSICAISTNGAVEGGGAYFMISRALGPEFGGGIGLLFFCAQVVSCALYTSGLVEAIVDNFGDNGSLISEGQSGLPISGWWNYLYATMVLGVCLTVCLVGGHLYGKTNIFTFMIVIVCALSVVISMFAKHGLCVLFPQKNPKSTLVNTTVLNYPNCSANTAAYTGLNVTTFKENVQGHYQEDYSTGHVMNFASVFAVLFSSVTGIMNGANMSGELKDPGKAIPKGTLSAASFTLGTFIVVLLLCSSTSTNNLLIGNYNFMLSVNLWPPFVAIGVFAATLSAALGNLIGGSRILYALAKDEIYGILLKPATVTTNGGNPIVAVLIAWVLVQLVLLIGSLNAIAPMCSEMFLLSYAMTNLACLALDLTSAPNFRPMFKYFSSHTAFLGMVGSLVMCFVINYIYALVAIAALIILVIGLHMRGFETSWGSISQALIFHQVRKYLLLLDSRKDHIKFWRPQMLLMVGNPRSCCQMIDFVNDLKKSGLYILGHVKLGHLDMEEVDPIQNEYRQWLGLIDRINVKAFVELTLAQSIREGMHHLIRLSGLGGMKPNTVCFGFYDDAEPKDTFAQLKRKQPRRKIVRLYGVEQNDDGVDVFDSFSEPNSGTKVFSGSEYVQMIYDTLKLKKNVCICRHFHQLDKLAIASKRQKMYIDVWPINFFNPESANHFDKTCLFVLQLACVLHMVPGWKKKTVLRIFTCIEEESEEISRKEARLADFLKLLRIRGEIKVVGWEHVIRRMQRGASSTYYDMHQVDQPLADDYLTRINQLILEHSNNTAIVFLYLPKTPAEEAKQLTYLHHLELLTNNLPPTVLVHGLQPVTCTSL